MGIPWSLGMVHGGAEMTKTPSVKMGKGKGRKPADVYQAATGHELPNEAVWIAIRQLRVFDKVSLYKRMARSGVVGVHEDTIKAYLKRLEKGGYLTTEIIPGETSGLYGAAKIYQYTLIRDVGVEAPRLNPSGNPTMQGRGNENMWRSMKMLRSFDFRELASASTTDDVIVTIETARKYVMFLSSAGYLVEVQAATHSAPTRYRLKSTMNTGPKSPMVQRTHNVYDPNIKRIIWREDAQ